MTDNKKGLQSYHKIWLWLMLGWTVSAADRGVTGPVVTWMINHHVAFFSHASNPHALGGLIGGLFFASFMLTQFPGGYIGDRYGHRTTIVLSLLWASLATLFGGLMFTLFGFIALRVITGLGEGMFYSNDRAVIAEVTPPEKRSFAMGFVITGLTFGVTLAYIGTALFTQWGDKLFGVGNGWQAPFVTFGTATLLVSIGLRRYFKSENREKIDLLSATKGCLKFFIPLFIAVMGIYYLSEQFKLSNLTTAIIEILVAFVLVAVVQIKNGSQIAPVLKNKNLLLLYISAIPFLWILWFFNFWSGDIIAKSGHASFVTSALLFALFNAGAGIAGFPLGGWLADKAYKSGMGRKKIYLIFIPVQALLTFWFGYYIMQGGHSLVAMSLFIFFCSLVLNLLQPISQAMTAELVDEEHRASAFGMWNLIGEMGAVLSPVIGGMIVDKTGHWYLAIFLGGIIMLASFFTVMFVKESK
ncbi:MFS transporter (plasmid) [Aneurinibacillus sp. Ricciae_BoGa-3]|uniref:MFS transporter n=1 Tax=Aneurinibacillus sp. Ricciae_BoGa-3 TaxID=3022697 RepID=UPI00233FA87E|nr:MFS transporter [Aneurinibacillus sp. Ricciae_BoGa-3]WCK57303.1 MFS transporter [Aneurinibacillus sp. Ricciae_BoGa-3]